MSFNFKWPRFDPGFVEKARMDFEDLVNSKDKPEVFVGRIRINELFFGTVPPDLELADIPDIPDEFVISIFVSYDGDARLGVQTNVQMNGFAMKPSYSSDRASHYFGLLAAHQPFVAPLHATLCNIKLEGVLTIRTIPKTAKILTSFAQHPIKNFELLSNFSGVPPAHQNLVAKLDKFFRIMFGEILPKVMAEKSDLLQKIMQNAQEDGIDPSELVSRPPETLPFTPSNPKDTVPTIITTLPSPSSHSSVIITKNPTSSSSSTSPSISSPSPSTSLPALSSPSSSSSIFPPPTITISTKPRPIPEISLVEQIDDDLHLQLETPREYISPAKETRIPNQEQNEAPIEPSGRLSPELV